MTSNLECLSLASATGTTIILDTALVDLITLIQKLLNNFSVLKCSYDINLKL